MYNSQVSLLSVDKDLGVVMEGILAFVICLNLILWVLS